MSKTKTLFINLYAGPGTGKSTSAAWIYALLKSRGVNAELIREYVKDWAWEGRKVNAYDQVYLLGKQVRRETLVMGKVEVAVTDSPTFQSLYYNRKYVPETLAQGVEAMVLAYYRQMEQDGHKHLHVFLNRTKPYSAAGRYQSEEEAKQVDTGVLNLLNEYGIAVTKCGTEQAHMEQLVEVIHRIKSE